MEAHTGKLYLAFDQERRTREAELADQQDAADLEALESTIKRRTKS